MTSRLGASPGHEVSAGLAQLIATATGVLNDGEPSPSGRLRSSAVRTLRQAMREALTQPDLLPDALITGPPPRPSGVGKHLLHREPAFTLLCLVTSPWALALTHDHGTWGLVGVYRGLEEEIRYVPVEVADDHSLVGLAEISRRVYTPGGVMIVEPPPRDVHQVINRGEESSITIHLLGADVVSNGFRTYAAAHLASATGQMEYDSQA